MAVEAHSAQAIDIDARNRCRGIEGHLRHAPDARPIPRESTGGDQGSESGWRVSLEELKQKMDAAVAKALSSGPTLVKGRVRPDEREIVTVMESVVMRDEPRPPLPLMEQRMVKRVLAALEASPLHRNAVSQNSYELFQVNETPEELFRAAELALKVDDGSRARIKQEKAEREERERRKANHWMRREL
jgi:hypothetical protein